MSKRNPPFEFAKIIECMPAQELERGMHNHFLESINYELSKDDGAYLSREHANAIEMKLSGTAKASASLEQIEKLAPLNDTPWLQSNWLPNEALWFTPSHLSAIEEALNTPKAATPAAPSQSAEVKKPATAAAPAPNPVTKNEAPKPPPVAPKPEEKKIPSYLDPNNPVNQWADKRLRK